MRGEPLGRARTLGAAVRAAGARLGPTGRGVGARRLGRTLARWAWAGGAPVRAVLVGLIRLYRLTLAGWVGGQCRFYPSCSEYAEGAIRNAGAVRGLALAVWRVLRCSPLSAGGVDRPPAGPGRGRTYDAIIRPQDGGGPAEVDP
jgi:putative membrane protein insertion efficiency factor